MSLTDLSIAGARRALRAGETTALALAEAHLDAIARVNPRLNAYVTLHAERTLEQARGADPRLPLGGIPLGLKDIFCTEGVRTTAGSKILGNFVPPYESTVTARLRAAGAVSLGKLNLDEFAMGSTNANSMHGPCINPWSPPGRDLVPGGSSGGSAAAVAARLALGATATDTGGSIRQPAALCGVVGIKPTYGRCSRWGIVAYASSLDQAGPMARTVEDCAILLGEMAGHDPKDSTSADVAVPDFAAACGRSVKGLRIGVPAEYRPEGLSPEIAAVWDRGLDWLREAGAEIVPVSLPHTRHALATYYIVAPAEASSNLARYDGVRFGLRELHQGGNLNDLYEESRAAGFGKEVQRRILIGTYVLSAGYYDAYYLKAQKLRALIRRDFDEAWRACDAILAPATPTAAFSLAEQPDDPVTMYLNDVFTITANLAGIPGLALPAGLSAAGLPLGLQLLGRPFEEETLFALGGAMEKATQFTHKPGIVA